MVQNGNKTYYHLDNLGGLGPERVQTGTKTDCLVHLSGIGSEIIPKMIPKLIIDTRQGSANCYQNYENRPWPKTFVNDPKTDNLDRSFGPVARDNTRTGHLGF